MGRSKLWVAVCWVLIIGTVVLVQFDTTRDIPNHAKNSTPEIAIRRFGKYNVGVKQLMPKTPASEKTLSKLERAFEDFHHNGYQLSSIPILMELSGRDTALRALEHMAANPDTVRNAQDLPIFEKLYREGSEALDSDEHLALERYGWVGELALSQDKPETSPERQAVLRSAAGMVMKVFLSMMAVMACLLGGVVLLIISIVFWVKGKISFRFVVPENPGGSLLEAFTIYLIGYMAIPYLILVIVPGFGIGALIIQVFSIPFSILWLLIRGSGWSACRAALGWSLGRGVFREIGAGMVGCIAGLPILFCAFIVVVIAAQLTGTMPYHPIVDFLGDHPVSVLLLACVFAPVVEETLFRGVFYGYLRRSFSWVVSGIISGLIFAAIHPQGWIAVPLLGTIGFILAAIREWRGSILAPMAAHSMINGAAVLITIAGM